VTIHVPKIRIMNKRTEKPKYLLILERLSIR